MDHFSKNTEKEDPSLAFSSALIRKRLVKMERERKLWRYMPQPVDVAALRRRTRMTQDCFARRFGFSIATVRHWERGDRKPHGPALVLLNLIARNPRAVLLALGCHADLAGPKRRHHPYRLR